MLVCSIEYFPKRWQRKLTPATLTLFSNCSLLILWTHSAHCRESGLRLNMASPDWLTVWVTCDHQSKHWGASLIRRPGYHSVQRLIKAVFAFEPESRELWHINDDLWWTAGRNITWSRHSAASAAACYLSMPFSFCLLCCRQRQTLCRSGGGSHFRLTTKLRDLNMWNKNNNQKWL